MITALRAEVCTSGLALTQKRALRLSLGVVCARRGLCDAEDRPGYGSDPGGFVLCQGVADAVPGSTIAEDSEAEVQLRDGAWVWCQVIGHRKDRHALVCGDRWYASPEVGGPSRFSS